MQNNTQSIYQKYHQDVRAFIFSKVKDDNISDDLLQDVFIKVHIKKDSLKDESKLKSWILTITHHTVMDYFRQLQHDTSIVDETMADEVAPQHTEQDCLHGILKNIPKKYATPIYLYDIKGMKQKDIATQLGRPLATIKSQIQRGRKMVAQGYIDCCGYTLNEDGKLVGEVRDLEDCKVCR